MALRQYGATYGTVKDLWYGDRMSFRRTVLTAVSRGRSRFTDETTNAVSVPLLCRQRCALRCTDTNNPQATTPALTGGTQAP